MKHRVPGYLGNTHYWFGNAGFGAIGMTARERRDAANAARDAARAKQQAAVQLKQQQFAARKALQQQQIADKRAQQQAQQAARRGGVPKPTAPPTITPKAAPGPAPQGMANRSSMAPGAPSADEAALMAELQSLTQGGEDDGEETMNTGGGGGGGGSPPSGAPAPTAEELILQREEMAAKVAAELAEEYGDRPIPQSILNSAMANLPSMPAPPAKRPGFIGAVLDAIFGPPPPIL